MMIKGHHTYKGKTYNYRIFLSRKVISKFYKIKIKTRKDIICKFFHTDSFTFEKKNGNKIIFEDYIVYNNRYVKTNFNSDASVRYIYIDDINILSKDRFYGEITLRKLMED